MVNWSDSVDDEEEVAEPSPKHTNDSSGSQPESSQDRASPFVASETGSSDAWVPVSLPTSSQAISHAGSSSANEVPSFVYTSEGDTGGTGHNNLAVLSYMMIEAFMPSISTMRTNQIEDFFNGFPDYVQPWLFVAGSNALEGLPRSVRVAWMRHAETVQMRL